MLRWLTTVVVSDGEKALVRRQVGTRKTNASEPLLTCRKCHRRHQNQGVNSVLGSAWRVSADWPGGVRHGGGVSLVCGFRVEQEKACPEKLCSCGQGRGSVPSGDPAWD